MSLTDFNPAQLDRVIQRQRLGADAGANAWVSASAGAGKTRVLRDRVLRLLLAGVPPQRVLCLTFTKAAAAEMSRRINAELGAWTVSDDAELPAQLSDLLGRDATDDERLRARQLFARVLDTPGGMKIMTIHAFCQSVLRRFPLEAGVVPHFRVMEERDSSEMMDEAQAELLASAHLGGGELSAAAATVARRVHETRFPELLNEIARARAAFAEFLQRSGGIEGAWDRMADRLGVVLGTDTDDILADACDDTAFDDAGLRQAVAGLAAGSAADQARAAEIGAWLAGEPAQRKAVLDSYAAVFLTQGGQGSVRKTLATKPVREADPALEDILAREAERLVALREALRKADLYQSNCALVRLAAELIARYEARKAASGRLDFDDLIARTRALLRGDGAAAWVLFKLDGGIDHVLIDEAQDTNPEQWDVVLSLVDEFFAGISARDESVGAVGLPERSVFAVGDAKQSIYSFQGADPARFELVRRHLEARADAARRDWNNVPLDFSFRSARPILEAVDKVFESPRAGDGVVDPDAPVQHTPLRDAAAGRVEIWPPVVVEKLAEPEPWKPPVDPVMRPGAMEQLAEMIAGQTADWLAQGEILESKGRPIEAEDIMVLVRQRGAFVEALVRAFKAHNVPVAGVDRMVLSEQMAVMDLLALGEFLLLPEDDLTLATVLKSPLVGFDEETLFALSHDRGEQTLWQALAGRREENEIFAHAHGHLSDLLGRVDYERPYELYAGLLAGGGRERLFARLGPDAADPIDEFLSLALSYERGHAPTLQGFLHWVAAGQAEVKRDLDQTGGAVRVMTVHGAKGLEAPIVFLPDTTRLPRHLPNILWDEDDQGPYFIWLPHAEDADATTGELRETVRARRDQEYRRLLYVAMTRAEERLYVCGWNEPAEGSWYNLVRPALEMIGRPVDAAAFGALGGEVEPVLRLSVDQRGPVSPVTATGDPELLAMPAWISQSVPPEPSPSRPLVPSDPGEDPPVRTPGGLRDDGARFRRGNILHRLLQWLPELPVGTRRDAAARYLARPGLALEETAQADLLEEIMVVLEAEAFAGLFGPQSISEVAVTGTVRAADGAAFVISGQIDRLVLSDGEVAIVDYKSNRPPPDAAQDVAPVYLRQMAAYRHLIAQAWPDRVVRAYLLWTDAPRLMELSADLLDRHAPSGRTSV
ncbi:MAG: double-strand break repair helicase AddA [Alphaproteobacteria bacterium]|nr:double-strand break repair helicase AddA [Alphaproteobacteria bacterium]